MDAVMMAEMQQRMFQQGQRMFYSEHGEFSAIKLEERIDATHILFRKTRKIAQRPKFIPRRLVLTDRSPRNARKPDNHYFIPREYRKKKAKYFRVIRTYDSLREMYDYVIHGTE